MADTKFYKALSDHLTPFSYSESLSIDAPSFRRVIRRSSITVRSSIEIICYCWHLRRHNSLVSATSRQQGGLATECPSASIFEPFRDVKNSPHTLDRDG